MVILKKFFFLNLELEINFSTPNNSQEKYFRMKFEEIGELVTRWSVTIWFECRSSMVTLYLEWESCEYGLDWNFVEYNEVVWQRRHLILTHTQLSSLPSTIYTICTSYINWSHYQIICGFLNALRVLRNRLEGGEGFMIL